jgi:peptidyl-dipeptidase Dcp
MWSEVLDATPFAAFEETGDIFDVATARSRDHAMLPRSHAIHEAILAFRGRLPSAEGLLKRRGLLDSTITAEA